MLKPYCMFFVLSAGMMLSSTAFALSPENTQFNEAQQALKAKNCREYRAAEQLTQQRCFDEMAAEYRSAWGKGAFESNRACLPFAYELVRQGYPVVGSGLPLALYGQLTLENIRHIEQLQQREISLGFQINEQSGEIVLIEGTIVPTAGLQVGDRILRIGRLQLTPQNAASAFRNQVPLQPVDIEFQRGESRHQAIITPTNDLKWAHYLFSLWRDYARLAGLAGHPDLVEAAALQMQRLYTENPNSGDRELLKRYIGLYRALALAGQRRILDAYAVLAEAGHQSEMALEINLADAWWPLLEDPVAIAELFGVTAAQLPVRSTLPPAAQTFTDLTGKTIPPPPGLEDQYRKKRDDFIRKFALQPVALDEEKTALHELTHLMERIIGPVVIGGELLKGDINLQTLREGVGFGQVDGLGYRLNRDTLMITTQKLMQQYLQLHPEYPQKIDALARTGDFYRAALHADAGVEYYLPIPLKSSEGTFAHAFLGLATQELGPFPPAQLYVLVVSGNRVLVAETPAKPQVPDLAVCRQIWNFYHLKHNESLKAYQAQKEATGSQLLADQAFRARDQGFEAYKHCYSQEATKQPWFAPLQEQAQSMVNMLQKNR